MREREHDPEADLERYLKKFQPRAIRPWKIPRRAGNPWWLRLAAVTALIVAGSMLLWNAQRTTTKPPETGRRHDIPWTMTASRTYTSPALTKLAVDDDKAFDRLLTDESRAAFPAMQAEPSALQVLAKE
jgi:hypothetical protein